MESAFTDKPGKMSENQALASVEYALSPEDHIAYWMKSCDKQVEQRTLPRSAYWILFALGMVLVIYGSLSFIWTLIFYLSGVPDPARQGFVMCGAFFGLGLILLAFLNRGEGFFPHDFRFIHAQKMKRLAKRYVQEGRIRIGRKVRVLLNQEGVIQLTEFENNTVGVATKELTETRFSWPAIDHIDLTDSHTFFQSLKEGGFIIPKTAFSDEQDYFQFVEIAKQLKKSFHAPDIPGRTPQSALPSSFPPEIRIKK